MDSDRLVTWVLFIGVLVYGACGAHGCAVSNTQALREALAEQQRLASVRRILDESHDGQKRVYYARDPLAPELPARRKAKIAPRRQGKTEGFLREAVHTCQATPGALVIYCADERDHAKQIAEPIMYRLMAEYAPDTKYDKRELFYLFGNGSRLLVRGADHVRFARLFEGLELSMFIGDEVQNWRYVDVRDIVEQHVGPALADQAGPLLLGGIPGKFEHGYFYDVVWKRKHPEWHVTQGVLYENPYNREAIEREVEAMKRANPDVESEPWFQRHWMGLWVTDRRELVVTMRQAQNFLYKGEWQRLPGDRYFLTVHFGYGGISGYVLTSWNPDRHPYLVYIDGWDRKAMGNVEHIEAMRRYAAEWPGLRIALNAGPQTKDVVKEFRSEADVLCEPAKKIDHDFHSDKVVADVSLGLIKVFNRDNPDRPQDAGVAKHWAKLTWDINPRTKERIVGKGAAIHKAALYARRLVNLSLFDPESLKEKTSTEKAFEAHEARQKKAEGHWS